MSLSWLIQKYGLGRDQFLHYQQLKFINKSQINLTNNTLQPSKLSEEFIKITNANKSSQNYKCISTSDTSITLPIKKWENDLNLSPKPDFWIEICKKNIYDH